MATPEELKQLRSDCTYRSKLAEQAERYDGKNCI